MSNILAFIGAAVAEIAGIKDEQLKKRLNTMLSTLSTA
jgi:hypothetical protein